MHNDDKHLQGSHLKKECIFISSIISVIGSYATCHDRLASVQSQTLVFDPTDWRFAWSYRACIRLTAELDQSAWPFRTCFRSYNFCQLCRMQWLRWTTKQMLNMLAALEKKEPSTFATNFTIQFLVVCSVGGLCSVMCCWLSAYGYLLHHPSLLYTL